MGVDGTFSFTDQSVGEFLPLAHVGTDVDCVFSSLHRVEGNDHVSVCIARDVGDAQGCNGFGWYCLTDLEGIPEYASHSKCPLN